MDLENISVPKLLLKMAPPVMLALLIQSIYNIADSFFVARYSTEGLTALSIQDEEMILEKGKYQLEQMTGVPIVYKEFTKVICK